MAGPLEYLTEEGLQEATLEVQQRAELLSFLKVINDNVTTIDRTVLEESFTAAYEIMLHIHTVSQMLIETESIVRDVEGTN